MYFVGIRSDFDTASRRAELMGYLSNVTWDESIKPRMKIILQHLQTLGFTKIALVGYCWGGWVVSSISADTDTYISEITVGVIAHPSMHIENAVFKRDTIALISK